MRFLIHSIIGTVVFLLLNNHVFAQNIVVIEEHDKRKVEGEYITEVKLGDGFRVKCSYDMGIEYLKEQAEQHNANLVKITQHKAPDLWSTCHRFKAALYKVADPGIYEDKIHWNKNRLLEWSDFRAKEAFYPIGEGVAATYCGILFETRAASTFSKPEFTVKTVFYKDKSWAAEDMGDRPNLVLNHERKHFDICEIYARLLYKELIKANLNAGNLREANTIYEKVNDEYMQRQYAYDKETNHGINLDAQERWNETIIRELSELDNYAMHY